jgi:putative sterol carrier protein
MDAQGWVAFAPDAMRDAYLLENPLVAVTPRTILESSEFQLELERIFGRGPVLKAVFQGMARRFVPDKAQGFSGGIQYELKGTAKTSRWAVRVAGDSATAHPGWAHDPAVTLRMSVPTFARIVSGDADPARSFLEGKIQIEGDFNVAARLGEMFGGPSPY